MEIKDKKENTPKAEVHKENEKDISKISEVKTPEIVSIEVPTPTVKDGDEPKAKRTYKKRTPKEKSKVQSPSIGQAEISGLISGVFSLIALKGGSHWNVSLDEADSVAKPLNNILMKMNLSEKVANVSDGAMLLMAVSMITIPRVILTQSMMKQNKETKQDKIKKEMEVKQIEQPRENKSSNPTKVDVDNRNSQGKPTISISNDSPIYSTVAQ